MIRYPRTSTIRPLPEILSKAESFMKAHPEKFKRPIQKERVFIRYKNKYQKGGVRKNKNT